MTNRLAAAISVDAEDGIRKLRASREEMQNVATAANKAEDAVDDLGDEYRDTARKTKAFSDSTERAGRATLGLQRAASGVSGRLAAIGVAGATAAAGLASVAVSVGAVRVGADFERQMSAVLAVTQAAQGEFETLQALARDLGATTVFSAKEAAEGMEFLARAGFDANEIVSALPGTLDLASAGALDLGRAADIASNALSGFGLETDEMGRISDVLAQAAASANTNVNQLGEALKFAAPSAQALGLGVEETIAAIGKLSDAGIQGGLAGRGFQSFTTALVKEKDTLEELIGDFDLQADGLADVLARIGAAGLSQQQVIDIFRAENIDIFTVLTKSALDAENGLDALIRKLEESQGFARETAEIMNDNLAGSLKAANSAFEELLLIISQDTELLEELTKSADLLTAALRSEEVKDFAAFMGGEFAEAIGSANELVDDLSNAFVGLQDIISKLDLGPLDDVLGAANRVRRFVEPRLPLPSTLIGQATSAVGGGIDFFAERGRDVRARENFNVFPDAQRIEFGQSILDFDVPKLESLENEADDAGDSLAELTKAAETAQKELEELVKRSQDLFADDRQQSIGGRFGSLDRSVADVLSRRDLQVVMRDLEALLFRTNEEQLAALKGGLIDFDQFSELQDELIREGDKTRDKLDELKDFLPTDIEVVADVVIDSAELGRDIIDGLSGALDLIRDPNASTFDKVTGSIEQIGGSVGQAFTAVGLPQIGLPIQAVAEAAGFIRDAVDFFKTLFGKNSDFTARAVFDPETGRTITAADDKAPENAATRDALIDSISEVAGRIAELVDGQIGDTPGTIANEGLLDVAVRSDRRSGVPYVELGYQAPNGAIVGGGRFNTGGSSV